MMKHKYYLFAKWALWSLLMVALGVLLFYGYVRYSKDDIRFSDPPVSVAFESSTLPIVLIDTKGKRNKIPRDKTIKVHLTVINNKDKSGVNWPDTKRHPGQHCDFDGAVYLRYRGGSSFGHAKRSYAIRLPKGNNGKKAKTSFLGMFPSSKWCLLAKHIDGTMMRDVLTHELSKDLFDFVAGMQYCELVVDGVYQGVYLLGEEVSRDRLGIKHSGHGDEFLKGGYLLEKDRDFSFRSHYPPRDSTGKDIGNEGLGVEIKYPDKKDLSASQLQHIQEDLTSMERAINEGTFEDFSQFIDVASFVRYQLIQELTYNVDAYRLSVKFYKEKNDDVFKMTPWDFDHAYGNAFTQNLFLNV